MLLLSDNQGVPLAMGSPQRGNHHNLHDIQSLFEELCKVLEQADINLKGVFMNADSGFPTESCGDAHMLREKCSAKQ